MIKELQQQKNLQFYPVTLYRVKPWFSPVGRKIFEGVWERNAKEKVWTLQTWYNRWIDLITLRGFSYLVSPLITFVASDGITIGWTERVARMGEIRNGYKNLNWKPRVRLCMRLFIVGKGYLSLFGYLTWDRVADLVKMLIKFGFLKCEQSLRPFELLNIGFYLINLFSYGYSSEVFAVRTVSRLTILDHTSPFVVFCVHHSTELYSRQQPYKF